MDYFDKLANKIKTRGKNLGLRSMAYFKRLLFPLYLFPVKLATYSLFYLVKFLLKLLLAVFGLMINALFESLLQSAQLRTLFWCFLGITTAFTVNFFTSKFKRN